MDKSELLMMLGPDIKRMIRDYLGDVQGDLRLAGDALITGRMSATDFSWDGREVELGWIKDNIGWLYSSSTEILRYGDDVSEIFPTGTKIRWKQGGGWLYARVVSADFDEGVVTLTVSGDTVLDAEVDENWFSYDWVPPGAPPAPTGEGLVVVKKSAFFSGTQMYAAAAGGNVAITDLSIDHALTKSTNSLILFGFVGTIANSDGYAQGGIAFAVDGSLIGVGDTAGSRTRVGAIGITASSSVAASNGLAIFYDYNPGTTTLKEYTLRAINNVSGGKILYINRRAFDDDGVGRSRACSGLILFELEG
jgi:hypothetical protein